MPFTLCYSCILENTLRTYSYCAVLSFRNRSSPNDYRSSRQETPEVALRSDLRVGSAGLQNGRNGEKRERSTRRSHQRTYTRIHGSSSSARFTASQTTSPSKITISMVATLRLRARPHPLCHTTDSGSGGGFPFFPSTGFFDKSPLNPCGAGRTHRGQSATAICTLR